MKHLRPIRFIRLMSMAFIAILMASCMQEGDDNCYSLVTLKLEYSHNMRYTDEIDAVVDTFKLYAYDLGTGQLAYQQNFSDNDLVATNYEVTLELPIGKYDLIGWVNTHPDFYDCKSKEDRYAAQIITKTGNNNEVDQDFVPFFHGKHNFNLKGKNHYEVMKLIKNTNYIDVYHLFDAPLPAGVTIESYITGCNGTYNFDNQPVSPSPRLTYIPRETITRAAQTNLHAYTTQRLWDGDDLELVVIKKEANQPDEEMKRLRVTPSIMSHPYYSTNELLDREDKYVFKFEYSLQGGGLMITDIYIDDWKLVENETGMRR